MLLVLMTKEITQEENVRIIYLVEDGSLESSTFPDRQSFSSSTLRGVQLQLRSPFVHRLLLAPTASIIAFDARGGVRCADASPILIRSACGGGGGTVFDQGDQVVRGRLNSRYIFLRDDGAQQASGERL